MSSILPSTEPLRLLLFLPSQIKKKKKERRLATGPRNRSDAAEQTRAHRLRRQHRPRPPALAQHYLRVLATGRTVRLGKETIPNPVSAIRNSLCRTRLLKLLDFFLGIGEQFNQNQESFKHVGYWP